MSIELLDKTRRINRLLDDRRSSKVAFADICQVLGQLMDSNAYVISSKGKMLGTYIVDSTETINGFQEKRGSYIDAKLNERFLNVLSTKENVNLETLGFSGGEAAGYEALITPISIAGERLGTLFLYRRQDSFSIEDIILIEYSTTVVGLEMMRAVQEEADQEEHKKKNFSSALTALTPLEQKAVSYVIHTLGGETGTLVTSKLAAEIGITRTVIVNALRKLESAGLIKTRSSGMKGTRIEILNDIVYTEFDSYYKEKWN
ncbi:MAG: GTP-sensing pleiotropic transcriptional regulator CodY [Eubacterium sp.]|jgi:Pleiotropic transcriptional repressor|nr:GTP-sensing pleiotropic transcriptional regulator CodY [Eubacterium sp.]